MAAAHPGWPPDCCPAVIRERRGGEADAKVKRAVVLRQACRTSASDGLGSERPMPSPRPGGASDTGHVPHVRGNAPEREPGPWRRREWPPSDSGRATQGREVAHQLDLVSRALVDLGIQKDGGATSLLGMADGANGLTRRRACPPQSHAPQTISAAETPKITGHSLKGRNATLKPVNRDTRASTTNVAVATA